MKYRDNLQSARLVTRFLTAADAELWMEYCEDPVATEFTRMEGKTPRELAHVFIDFTLKRYEDGRGGLQMLIHKKSGEMVGMCGLFTQEVNGKTMVEIGYHLLRRYWGMGYATEAAQLFRDYGFENEPDDTLVSIIDPKNERSKQVAMRNGMQLIATGAQFRGGEYDLFGITRAEWLALSPG